MKLLTELDSLDNVKDGETRILPTKVSQLQNDSGYITGLVMLEYGTSTWQDFQNAFNSNKIVYCKVNGRMAFLAYISTSNVEFQYYRSLSSPSVSSQPDEVYVYTLTNANKWTTTTRKASSTIAVGTGLSRSYTANTRTMTLSVDTSTMAQKSDLPTKTSDLTNDSGFITGYTETDPVFTASAASGITSSDITNWNSKQTALVSGTNIKTINNESLLGSGNINITSGGGSATDVQVNGSSIVSNDVANLSVEGNYNASTNKIATMSEIPTVPTTISSFTNDSGYINEVTSSDVYNALGYTPEAEPSIYRLSSIRQITSTDDETYIHLTNDMDNGTPIIINTGTGGCNVIGTRTTLSGISRSLWFMTSDNSYGKITFTKSGTSVTVTIEDIDIPTATSDLTNDSNFAVTNANNNFSSSQSITGDLIVSGTAQIQNGLYCRPTGQVNTPVGNDMLVVKRASRSEDSTPNNGVVLEFGNSTSWTGQLYIGDNATQGIYYNGWSDGVRGSWIKLASQNDLQPVTLWEGTFTATSTSSITWTTSKYNFKTLRIAYKLDNWGDNAAQFVDVPNNKAGVNNVHLSLIYGFNNSRQQIRNATIDIYEKSASWESARTQYRELSTNAVTGGGNASANVTISVIGIYGLYY